MRPISVIIPVALGERNWETLLPQLHALPPGSEIIFGSKPEKFEAIDPSQKIKIRCVDQAVEGRAVQMNAAAHLAQCEWLWFVHADSEVTDETLLAAMREVASKQKRLIYFDLQFKNDGPVLMKLNEWAVRLRSNLAKMPFGDQGFLISKELPF